MINEIAKVVKIELMTNILGLITKQSCGSYMSGESIKMPTEITDIDAQGIVRLHTR